MNWLGGFFVAVGILVVAFAVSPWLGGLLLVAALIPILRA